MSTRPTGPTTTRHLQDDTWPKRRSSGSRASAAARDAAAEAAAEAAAAAAAAAKAEEEAVAAEKAADEACADDGPLQGCVVCTTGLEPSLRERIRRAVESLGGEYSPGLTHATTHLLARAAAGDKYAIAASRPAAIAIATPDWALRCAAARARLPAADFALPPFAGVHACCSGLPAARRAAVAAAVAGGGGAYRGDMDVDVVTHLVTDAPRGAKYEAARRARGCRVVSPAWVDACVAAGARVPEAPYEIAALPEEGEAAAASAAEGDAAAAAGSAAAGGSADAVGSPQGDDAFTAQLARARESGALSGCRVLLAGFAAPRAAALATALRRARATRHAQPHPLLTHVVLGDPALVDARTLEALASRRRAPRVVTAQWVFDSAAAAAALPAERYLAPPIARRDSSRQDARKRNGAAPAPAPLTDMDIAESAFAPMRPRAQPLFTSNSQPPAGAGGAAAARKRRRTTGGGGGGAVTFGGTRVEDGAFAPFSADCSSASAAARSGDAGDALDQLLSGIGFVLPRGGFTDEAEAAAVRARLEAHGGSIVADAAAGTGAAAAADADDDADDIRDAPQLCYVMCARGHAPPDGTGAAAAAAAGTLACGGAITPLWLEACVRKRRVYRADAWPLFSPTAPIAAAAAPAAAVAAAAARGAAAAAAARGAAVAPLQHFARGRGFAVCFTQVEGAERAGLEAAAALAGADVLEVLNRHVTHLVCGAPRGAKWEAAARYDAHIVSRGWLLHCLEHGYAHGCEAHFALAPGAAAAPPAAAAAAAGGTGSSEQEAPACVPATGAAAAAYDGCDDAISAAAAAATATAAAPEADAFAEDSLPPVPPSPDREPPSEPSQFTQVGLASLEAALLEARGGGGGGDGRRRTRMRRNLAAAAVAPLPPEAPPPSAATGGASGGGGGGSSGSGTSQADGLLKISLAELERGGLASGKRLRSRGSFGASLGLYRGGESMAVESQVVEYEE